MRASDVAAYTEDVLRKRVSDFFMRIQNLDRNDLVLIMESFIETLDCMDGDDVLGDEGWRHRLGLEE